MAVFICDIFFDEKIVNGNFDRLFCSFTQNKTQCQSPNSVKWLPLPPPMDW